MGRDCPCTPGLLCGFSHITAPLGASQGSGGGGSIQSHCSQREGWEHTSCRKRKPGLCGAPGPDQLRTLLTHTAPTKHRSTPGLVPPAPRRPVTQETQQSDFGVAPDLDAPLATPHTLIPGNGGEAWILVPVGPPLLVVVERTRSYQLPLPGRT